MTKRRRVAADAHQPAAGLPPTGCATHTPCADASGAPHNRALPSAGPLATSFGQHWRHEGRSPGALLIMIVDFAIEDVGDEACYFDSTYFGATASEAPGPHWLTLTTK